MYSALTSRFTIPVRTPPLHTPYRNTSIRKCGRSRGAYERQNTSYACERAPKGMSATIRASLLATLGDTTDDLMNNAPHGAARKRKKWGKRRRGSMES